MWLKVILEKVKIRKIFILISLLSGLSACILGGIKLYQWVFPDYPILINENISLKKIATSNQNIKAIKNDEIHPYKTISFLLSNPGDDYAILKKLCLIVTNYKPGYYMLPEPGRLSYKILITPLTRLEALSGPIEKYKRKFYLNDIRLNKKSIETNLCEAINNVFPKGETEEFVITVIASDPGKYRYKISQEWLMPRKNKKYVTYTKEYYIENKQTFDIHDTFELSKV